MAWFLKQKRRFNESISRGCRKKISDITKLLKKGKPVSMDNFSKLFGCVPRTIHRYFKTIKERNPKYKLIYDRRKGYCLTKLITDTKSGNENPIPHGFEIVKQVILDTIEKRHQISFKYKGTKCTVFAITYRNYPVPTLYAVESPEQMEFSRFSLGLISNISVKCATDSALCFEKKILEDDLGILYIKGSKTFSVKLFFSDYSKDLCSSILKKDVMKKITRMSIPELKELSNDYTPYNHFPISYTYKSTLTISGTEDLGRFIVMKMPYVFVDTSDYNLHESIETVLDGYIEKSLKWQSQGF